MEKNGRTKTTIIIKKSSTNPKSKRNVRNITSASVNFLHTHENKTLFTHRKKFRLICFSILFRSTQITIFSVTSVRFGISPTNLELQIKKERQSEDEEKNKTLTEKQNECVLRTHTNMYI